MSSKLRVGVAGPVGSGKTALVETLCIGLKKKYKVLKKNKGTLIFF